jgi:hypothetical protein
LRLCLSSVSNSPPNRTNASVQRSIGYGTTAPNLIDQFVFADDPIRILGKVQKQIEGSRFHLNYTNRAFKFPAGRVDQEIGKLQQHDSTSAPIAKNESTLSNAIHQSKIARRNQSSSPDSRNPVATDVQKKFSDFTFALIAPDAITECGSP